MADENITVTAPRRKHDPNELRVVVNGVSYGGWQGVRVTRGIERMPSDFEVALTEKFPGQTSDVVIKPGQACTVYLGDDRVLTGWVDSYGVSLNASRHDVTISGRGRCADLRDSAAGFDKNGPTGGQIGNSTIKQIATILAAPFGITVTDLGSDAGWISTQININFGETVLETLAGFARLASRLVYEDTAGNLVLAQVGKKRAASGFVQGVNIQAVTGTFTMAERFSDYYASLIGTDTLSDVGDAGFIVAHILDPGVPRFRPTVNVSAEFSQTNGVVGMPLAKALAIWESVRRWGRSQAVTLVCDSWRDSAGALWTPNTLAQVTIPALKLDTSWTISEVSFLRGEGGTTAQLTLMPPEAFTPEPIALQGFDWQAAQGLNPGGATI